MGKAATRGRLACAFVTFAIVGCGSDPEPLNGNGTPGTSMAGESGAGDEPGGDAGAATGGTAGKSGGGGGTTAGDGDGSGEAGDAGAPGGRAGSGGEGGSEAGGGGEGAGPSNPCDGLFCVFGTCVTDVTDGSSARCECQPGYQGLQCEYDIDECKTNNGLCDPLTLCTNQFGGRTCGACPEGMLGDGYTGCRPMCVTAADCDALLGPALCLERVCNERGICDTAPLSCNDDDGDGVNGPECECGPIDCDDQDESVGEEVGCYSGPPATRDVGVCKGGLSLCSHDGPASCRGERVPSPESCNGEDDDCDGEVDELGDFTCGVGVCRRTVTACQNGVLSACTPGEPSSSGDGCNDLDDDCDGAADEDCPTCLHVAPDGDDQSALASNGTSAFRNLQPAIDFAAAHRDVATRVCVAAGSDCAATTTYAGPSTDLTMRDGISVYANYRSSDWTRCTDSTTQIALGSPAGVVFPSSIMSSAILDGFSLARFAAATTSGVTVNGAHGVVLSDLTIGGTATAEMSRGVDVTNGGSATILGGTIDGGTASLESVGVRAVGGHVIVHGATVNGGSTLSPGAAHAVLLDGAPSSRIEDSTLSSITHSTSDNPTQPSTGVRIVRDAQGVVIRRNTIRAAAYVYRYGRPIGIELENCGGASPWIVQNSEVAAWGSKSSSTAISSSGDCHPVIESNDRVYVPAIEAGPSALAIRCVPLDERPSRCVIAGNANVYSTYGRQLSGPPVSYGAEWHLYGFQGSGIYCGPDSCARISNNHVTGNKDSGLTPSAYRGFGGTGIALASTGTFVERNVIEGGCYRSGAGTVGLVAAESWSRIENNLIRGSTGMCPSFDYTDSYPAAVGIQVISAAGARELDVHSNLIESGSAPMGIFRAKAGIQLTSSTSAPPMRPLGVFRNNVFEAVAWLGYAVEEVTDTTDPRVLENNAFRSLGYDLYRDFDRPSASIRVVSELNLFVDVTASANIDWGSSSLRIVWDPFHLLSDSPLIDAGTTAGAPRVDRDGQPRDARPDIGPDEFSN